MTAFARGDDRSEESEPEHQVTEKNISPLNACMKKIPEHDLAECHDDHDAEKKNN
jgi:hypothetical protein